MVWKLIFNFKIVLNSSAVFVCRYWISVVMHFCALWVFIQNSWTAAAVESLVRKKKPRKTNIQHCHVPYIQQHDQITQKSSTTKPLRYPYRFLLMDHTGLLWKEKWITKAGLFSLVVRTIRIELISCFFLLTAFSSLLSSSPWVPALNSRVVIGNTKYDELLSSNFSFKCALSYPGHYIRAIEKMQTQGSMVS